MFEASGTFARDFTRGVVPVFLVFCVSISL